MRSKDAHKQLARTSLSRRHGLPPKKKVAILQQKKLFFRPRIIEKCFHHELRHICRVVSPVYIVQQFYTVLYFAKGANDCERASELARARSYQTTKLNLNENHFLGNIHVTKRSVREIDRCEETVSSFFLSGKKATFYFRYSTNHSSRQILDNILWSLAGGHELFSTDVRLSRHFK